jgi:cytochrome c-type biogenesis protein CcmE
MVLIDVTQSEINSDILKDDAVLGMLGMLTTSGIYTATVILAKHS